MKKIYEYIGLAALIIFSFFITNEARIYIQNKNPLVKEISGKSNGYNVKPVNAEIKNETIIPGINGREVNVIKSYKKMKDFGLFNELFLVYKYIRPETSLRDNLKKIVIQGNKSKKQISLLLEYNFELVKYVQDNNISANLLITDEAEIADKLEIINNVVNASNYSSLEKSLSKREMNSNYCLENNKHNCNKKVIVRNTDTLTSVNLTEVKGNIKNGSIIIVTKNVSVASIKILITQIEFQGLKIVPISKLLSEDYE